MSSSDRGHSASGRRVSELSVLNGCRIQAPRLNYLEIFNNFGCVLNYR
jgi:hypothetical protein